VLPAALEVKFMGRSAPLSKSDGHFLPAEGRKKSISYSNSEPVNDEKTNWFDLDNCDD
jgi:hypothetical protein